MLIYEILQITDVKDETVDKYTDRNRVGKIVSPSYPIKVGTQLVLRYIGGEKDGKSIIFTTIGEVKKTDDPDEIKVYTKNSMVRLRYKGILTKPGTSGAFMR